MNFQSSINPFWFIFITFAVALIPIILGVCTSYLKISIVLTLLRNGFGTQQFPGNILILVLSFSLSLFIMFPVYQESIEISKEFQNKKFSEFSMKDAINVFKKISIPWKKFMIQHSGEKEMLVLRGLREDFLKEQSKNNEKIDIKNDKDTKKTNNKKIKLKEKKEKITPKKIAENQEEDFPIVLLSFLFSELKEAFAMSVSLLIPFLIIDIIVANILVGLGMYMLSPSLISLPIKILIFVLIDGWLLLGKSLIFSYGM